MVKVARGGRKPEKKIVGETGISWATLSSGPEADDRENKGGTASPRNSGCLDCFLVATDYRRSKTRHRLVV